MKNSWSAKIPRPVSAEAKATVRAHLGELKTAVLHQLNTSLPWYRDLPASQRASLGECAGLSFRGGSGLREHKDLGLSADWVHAPAELSRTALQQAVQHLRTVLQWLKPSWRRCGT